MYSHIKEFLTLSVLMLVGIFLIFFLYDRKQQNTEINDIEYQELYIVVAQQPSLKPLIRDLLSDNKITRKEYDILKKEFRYTNKQVLIHSITQ